MMKFSVVMVVCLVTMVIVVGEGAALLEETGDDGFGECIAPAVSMGLCANWVARSSPPVDSTDQTVGAIDVAPGGERIYVAGWRWVAGGASVYSTHAYDAHSGEALWHATFGEPDGEHDRIQAVRASPDGASVFVTGWIGGSGALGLAHGDYATVAYDAESGDELWNAIYDGGGYDLAYGVDVAPDGSLVYVTGRTDPEGGGDDDIQYLTIAYSTENGEEVWNAIYPEPGVGVHIPLAVSAAPDGSQVFVTGYSWMGSAPDYATIAYNATTGEQSWIARYNGSEDFWDQPWSLVTSPDSNLVFVTGGSAEADSVGRDFTTIAYDAATGEEIWVSSHGEVSAEAKKVTISPDGTRLFVTGSISDPNSLAQSFMTLAYDPLTGELLWESQPELSGTAYDLTVHPDGDRVFVSGVSPTFAAGGDRLTLALDASTGQELWSARHNEPDSYIDRGQGITISPDGESLFITGTSTTAPSTSLGTPGKAKIVTLAYDAEGPRIGLT